MHFAQSSVKILQNVQETERLNRKQEQLKGIEEFLVLIGQSNLLETSSSLRCGILSIKLTKWTGLLAFIIYGLRSTK